MLHRDGPYQPLVETVRKKDGRNNLGRITVRHRGGAHKRLYRIIDFKRNKDGIPAKVERLEYDPNRSANIALLLYADGERRYIIAPKNMMPGATVISGPDVPIAPGKRAATGKCPVWDDRSLCGNETREGCSVGTLGWNIGAVSGARRQIRPDANAFWRSSKNQHQVSCDNWRGWQWRTRDFGNLEKRVPSGGEESVRQSEVLQ